MAAMSDYLENHLIDHVLRGVPYTAPTHLYMALFTAAPSDSGGGTEVSGSSYARVTLDPSTTNWSSTGGATTTTNPSAGTSGTSSNNVAISFPTPSGSWGTITHVGIFDAITSGNLLFWGALSVSLAVTGSSTPFSFPISALAIQLDN
jgi:hypothetical protein